MEQLYERLNKAMKIRKMRAVDLCAITGISKGAMSTYISGKFKPKGDRLHLIAKALSVNEVWLLGLDDAQMDRTSISFLDSKSALSITVGNKVRQMLVARKMLISDLAEQSGLTIGDVEKIIEGYDRPFNLELMYKFAQVLNVHPLEFFMDLPTLSDFGRAITMLRKINNVTSEELAAGINVSVNDLNMFESGTGHIPYKTIEKICDYFGIIIAVIICYNLFEMEYDDRFVLMLKLAFAVKEARRNGMSIDFTPEELQEIKDYAIFLASKRKS